MDEERFGISKKVALQNINRFRNIVLDLRDESKWSGKANFNETWETLNYTMQHMDSLLKPELSDGMFVFHMDCILTSLKKVSVKPSLKEVMDKLISVLTNLTDLMCTALLINSKCISEQRKITD